MRVLGIDAGVTGGCAVWDTDARSVVSAIHVPMMGEGASQEINAPELRNWIRSTKPDRAYIERAQAMPRLRDKKSGKVIGQGASSAFKYGGIYFGLRAIVLCCDVPLEKVEAPAWKKYHNLKGGSKEDSRQRALLLVPTASALIARKMDDGVAEAILIAIYGGVIGQGTRAA